MSKTIQSSLPGREIIKYVTSNVFSEAKNPSTHDHDLILN